MLLLCYEVKTTLNLLPEFLLNNTFKPLAMLSNILRNEMAVIKQLKLQPFITLIHPFDPKMTSKFVLEKRLKSILDQIKYELYEYYSFTSAKDVYEKLVNAISHLDYNTHKKSIAILISTEECKTIYLDVPVEEKFFITNSFQFRQLVRQQRDEEYLLVVLNENYAAVYRGLGKTITKILHNIPDYRRQEVPAANIKNKNFNEQEVLKFVLSIDKSLSLLLNAFPLPVFVTGPQNLVTVFRQITHNSPFLVQFIEGSFNSHSEDEIERYIQPYINNWRPTRDRFLLQQLEGAMEEGKMETGIGDVWDLAHRKNIKLLVVEEGYSFKAYLGKGIIGCAEEATGNAYIKDAVDDVVEMVLSYGGKVSFVSSGTLQHYMHIAAIRNY